MPTRSSLWTKLTRSWFELTAPPLSSLKGDFEAREVYRRGRLLSTILFFLTLLGLLATPSVLSSQSASALSMHLVSLVANVLALAFNRYGASTIAGLLTITGITLTFASNLLGPIEVITLPIFELLVISELIAVTVLPKARWVFPVAAINILFAWYDINYLPHGTDFERLLALSRFGITSVPIVLYTLVAVVSFLWVSSAVQAIKRADRAEEIALLQRRVAEREHHEAEQKRVLDEGIGYLVSVFVRATNGDKNVRAALTRDKSLWPIITAFNKSLERFRRYDQLSRELAIAKEEAKRLNALLQSRILNH